ncbi:MAG: alkaline phosphatase family protein [Thermoanaerobaculaceae bacterium]|nr:alkaline phosphatase family protein [Thermoanaerobaculaceae bacterium]
MTRPDRSTRHAWRRLAAVILVAALAVPTLATGAAAAPAASPTLAVIVVVDGLSWARFEHDRPLYVAGFKRLFDEGLVCGNSRYRHINTETGPGHASLATGAPPRVHGIVVNQWLETGPDGTQRAVYCAAQPAPPPARGTVPGAANLRVETLGDRLVATWPDARVVTVSGKDRAAIFLAGHDPRHTAAWFDADTGRFATSPAYDATGPAQTCGRAVLEAFNEASGGTALAGRLGTVWSRVLAPVATPAGPWAVPAERLADYQIPVHGLLFPHDLAANRKGYFYGVYTSPLVDELTADLAIAFVNDPALGLGRRSSPDLLAVSFSAQDLVSHNYGPESEENLDVLRRLDLLLGRMLDTLDRRVGKGRYVVAFSADHGFSPIPEFQKQSDRASGGGRLVDGARVAVGFVQRVNRLLDQRLGLDPASRPVAGVEGWALYYTRPLAVRAVAGPRGPASRVVGARDVDAALPEALATLFAEELAGVDLASQAASWPAADPMTEFVRNDFDPARSGDATLIPKPGVLMHWDPGRGTGHGSPYEPDTHVPLIFLGGPFAPGRLDADTTPYDLAPTLASLLAVSLPAAAGRSLAPAPPEAPAQSRPK